VPNNVLLKDLWGMAGESEKDSGLLGQVEWQGKEACVEYIIVILEIHHTFYLQYILFAVCITVHRLF
jgi:hypothetical protein